MKPDRPIIITGATGLLGHALCRIALDQGPIIGIYHIHKPICQGGHWIHLDLTDATALADCIRTAQPGAVIHAAAVAQTGRCQSRDAATEAINVTVPGQLADICADLGIPMAFTSTDLVFDGSQPPYNEDSPPSPLSVYGEQKARAEALVLDRWPEALVCRMPLMMGAAPHADTNFTVQMLTAIATGQPVTLFHDEFRTPVDIWSAARGIAQFLGHQNGVIHLGGHRRVSRLEIGMAAARYMGIAPTMIRSASAAVYSNGAPRALDCSLDSQRAFKLGYTPDDYEQGMQRTIDHWIKLRRR